MGLISSIAKVGLKACKWGKRALKCAPEFIFGESASVISKAYKAAPKGSIFSKAKFAGKAFESHVTKLATKGGFFTRLLKTTLGLPKALFNSTKAGMRLAGMKGTSKILGGLKGLGKGLAKKMPYIGALITIGLELPSIINGYKKEGITGALKQCAGAGVELGCMAAGAAIGSCICPGAGSLIGGIIGGLVGWGVRALTIPEPEDDEEGTEPTEATQQQDQDTDTSEIDEDSSTETTTSDSSSSSSSTSTTPSGATSGTTTGTSAGTTTTETTPLSTVTGMTNPFGMSTMPIGFGSTNPFGMNMGMGFGYPFVSGMNFGYGNPFGGFNQVDPLSFNLISPGENIFLKYPMGYVFSYQ